MDLIAEAVLILGYLVDLFVLSLSNIALRFEVPLIIKNFVSLVTWFLGFSQVALFEKPSN